MEEFDEGVEVNKPDGKAQFAFFHAIQDDWLQQSLVAETIGNAQLLTLR